MKQNNLIIPEGMNIQNSVHEKAVEFIHSFNIYEIDQGSKLVLYHDQKSNAYYINCHLSGKELSETADLQASLDSNDDDVIYKLNRDITEDKAAYKQMVLDSSEGRSFEDLVLEYDTAYQEEKPLKVYGGQHRIRAIFETYEQSSGTFHGVRVYFDLTRDQKVEIATINNTSIAVSNDLLDRMREQMIGSELRDWCQKVGLLGEEVDFADKKDPDIPTVRVARTLVVNYWNSQELDFNDFHQPLICKSGGLDEDYQKVRQSINWSDESMIEMGKEFARLHKIQRAKVRGRSNDSSAEFARKALSHAVVASWSYAAGLFQKNPDFLKKHYALPDTVRGSRDPLAAKDLSKARLKGVDPDTYRGLGTRTGPKELGRMLEVFIIQATRENKQEGIFLSLANAAIKSYEAKRAKYEADRALGNI